jgi:uncharacterized HhH-GPD family protein
VATTTAPDRLHFTGDDEADALLAREPFALLVGFAIDQQVPVPTAFSGPFKLKQRLATDPARLDELFREKPAIHRFPGAMAARVHELAAVVAEDYDGDASRVWSEAENGTELRRRIESLPGFGKMKVTALGSVLAKRFGVEAARELVPTHPTLGDVDSPEALQRFQDAKREYKARLKRERAS